jgi:hypothetical protein
VSDAAWTGLYLRWSLQTVIGRRRIDRGLVRPRGYLPSKRRCERPVFGRSVWAAGRLPVEHNCSRLTI